MVKIGTEKFDLNFSPPIVQIDHTYIYTYMFPKLNSSFVVLELRTLRNTTYLSMYVALVLQSCSDNIILIIIIFILTSSIYSLLSEQLFSTRATYMERYVVFRNVRSSSTEKLLNYLREHIRINIRMSNCYRYVWSIWEIHGWKVSAKFRPDFQYRFFR